MSAGNTLRIGPGDSLGSVRRSRVDPVASHSVVEFRFKNLTLALSAQSILNAVSLGLSAIIAL